MIAVLAQRAYLVVSRLVAATVLALWAASALLAAGPTADERAQLQASITAVCGVSMAITTIWRRSSFASRLPRYRWEQRQNGSWPIMSSCRAQALQAPVQTLSHTTGPVESATTMPDGTPLFAQDGTGFVNVFRGLNGESAKNVYTRCCGYHESLAVDTAGLAQVAFYSNADPDGATVYEALGADLTPTAPTLLKPVAEHEAPLVADRSGNTFLAWAPGSPLATGISVVPFSTR